VQHRTSERSTAQANDSSTSGPATAKTTGGKGVTVQTSDSGGNPDDLDSFTVAVFCRPMD